MSKAMQVYPKGLVDAIVDGIKLQKSWDEQGIVYLGKVEAAASGAVHDDENPPEEENEID